MLCCECANDLCVTTVCVHRNHKSCERLIICLFVFACHPFQVNIAFRVRAGKTKSSFKPTNFGFSLPFFLFFCFFTVFVPMCYIVCMHYIFVYLSLSLSVCDCECVSVWVQTPVPQKVSACLQHSYIYKR